MQVARVNAAAAIAFRASFFPDWRVGACPMGEIGAEMLYHPAGPCRWSVRPRSRVAGASTARVIQPAGFPLRLSGVADWSSANASFPPSPGPADRQCRPLVPPSTICRDAYQIGCVTLPNPQHSETGMPQVGSAAAQFYRRAQGSGAAVAGMAEALGGSMAAPVRLRLAGHCPPRPTPPTSRRRWRCRAAPRGQGRARRRPL
jgi:hypothetical protein